MRRRTCGRCHQLIEQQQRNDAAEARLTWRFVEHDRVVSLGAPSVQCEGSNVNEYYSRKPAPSDQADGRPLDLTDITACESGRDGLTAAPPNLTAGGIDLSTI